LTREGDQYRNMWCTGGFLHAAGFAVGSEGKFAPANEIDSPLFTFDPVHVQCNAVGITTWTLEPQSHNRFLFHVRDEKRYGTAMTSAMRNLLSSIP
jgi:hypothetical protein